MVSSLEKRGDVSTITAAQVLESRRWNLVGGCEDGLPECVFGQNPGVQLHRLLEVNFANAPQLLDRYIDATTRVEITAAGVTYR